MAEVRFDGQQVTVVGLAREGTALARFLTERGATVTVTDHIRPVRFPRVGAGRDPDLKDHGHLALDFRGRTPAAPPIR